MGWYTVKTLTKSSIPTSNDKMVFDESIMLVEAANCEEAEEKAKNLVTKLYLPVYENIEGKTVKWEFVKIIEVLDLCEDKIYSGIQVFTRIYEARSPEN